MSDKLFDNIFLVLISIIPISILIGPAVSLTNIIIFDFIFIYFLFLKKDLNWTNSLIIKLLLFLYTYLIFNSLISQQAELNLSRNLGFIRLIIFFVGLNYLFNEKKNLNNILKVWSIVIIIVVVDIFIEKIFGKNILGFSGVNSPGSERIVSFFKDEAIPGSFVYAFSFILIGFFLEKIKKFKFKSLIMFLLLIIILLIAVVVTGERSNSLKFLISLILFFMFLKEISFFKKFFLFGSVLSILFLIVSNDNYLKSRVFETSFYLIDTYKESFSKPNPLPGGNTYAELSRSGFEVFKKYPYFGVGNKNYRVESCFNDINKNYYCETHPHQIYFELLSEHGLLGSVLLLTIFLLIFYNILKNILVSKNYISLGCLVYLIAIFTPLLPSGAFFADYNLTLFFINLSIMYASNKNLNIFNYDKKIRSYPNKI
tara:strand:+ start:269 stop:1552 length:1284 start_codon:yes stop_codon:yes gene_type:complete